MADITVAARVPPDVKAALTKLAKENGKKLSPYVSELLTRHALGTSPPGDPSARTHQETPRPAADSDIFLKLTEAVRSVGEMITDYHAADRAERDDFYRALLAVFFGQFRALESTSFTEEKTEKFMNECFRKPLLGED